MFYPSHSNELVEERAKAFMEAVNDQFGGKIIGHVHFFIWNESEIDKGNSIILHFIPENLDTDHNMILIARDLLMWAAKRNQE